MAVRATGRRARRKRFGSREQILGHLRRLIISGELAAGDRLPTRDDLVQSFSTSKRTVQEALVQLAHEGLAHARGPLGTYVSDSPRTVEYGLVFEARTHPAAPWSTFLRTIQHEAEAVGTALGRRLICYYSSAGHPEGEDYRHLMWDVQIHRVAGLVFVNPPFVLATSPAVRHPDMPRIGIMASPTFGIPAVYPDSFSFEQRALDYLRSRGRTRLGVVLMGAGGPLPDAHIEETARQRGLSLPTYCRQYCGFGTAEAATNITHVLMRLPPADRPNGLLLGDDNLVDPALAGLVAAGARVPEDVEVVAHCNYPLDHAAPLPVVRLGFDCRTLLRRCVELLDVVRLGGRAPDLTLVPAIFEQEFVKSAAGQTPTSRRS